MRVRVGHLGMRPIGSTFALLFALLLPIRGAASQAAELPSMDVIRGWIQEHHSQVISGDSGMNTVIIVVDTNAKYVRSIALRLSATDLATTQGGMMHAATMQDDSTWTNRLWACARGAPERKVVRRPLCILDSARVEVIDGLHLFTSRTVDVLQDTAAAKRYGSSAAYGAVIVTTDTAALGRYTRLGATAASFVLYQQQRIRRRADGQPLLITVVMLRGT